MALDPRQGESYAIDVAASNVAVTNTQKSLKDFLNRRHPKYKDLLPQWNFAQATYDGGREWFKPNVFRYIKEGDVEFNGRIERAYRFNHTREVVDLVNKYLFKQEIVRNTDDAPKELAEFWNKATRNGLTIKDFVRQVSKKTSQFGRIGIVVDSTLKVEIDSDQVDAENPVLSRADVKNADAQVYTYCVGPQQILDYAYDEDGSLLWILIHEIARDDKDPMTSTGKALDRFRLWTKTDWKLWEIQSAGKSKRNNIVMINDGTHDLGEVPVILADHIIGDEEYSASSLIDDIAYLDRAVANYLSNLDAIIQDQTFSQLAMPAQNLLPGEETKQKIIEMGTSRMFLYDGNGGGVPQFISPDVKQAGLLITVINKIIGEIYNTVGLAGERTKEDNSVGIDNSSGVAKAYDFERVNALLSAKADSLEFIERKIARLVMKWHGEDDVNVSNYISYPDNFDTRGLYDEFDIAARLMLVDAPDEVRRAQMQFVVDKLFPQIGKELKNKMIDELKKWPIDPIELTSGPTQNQSNPNGDASISKADAKEPSGTPTQSATKNNRQGQVTKDTK